MTDQLLFEEYLLILKGTTEVYVHGTLESSNNDVHSLLNTGLSEILTQQANTYQKMKECGWYSVSNVDKNVINNTLEQLKNK